MRTRLVLAFVAACALGTAWSQQRNVAQDSANRSLQIIRAVHGTAGGQDGAMRRCRAYMDEATSAEKLGSRDMAEKNWEKAARGCKANAVSACKVQLKTSTTEHCEGLAKLYP